MIPDDFGLFWKLMKWSWIFENQQCHFYAYFINVLGEHVIFENQLKKIWIYKFRLSLKSRVFIQI